MVVNDPNVGIAFALVIGAGLATGLGAAVVFFPTLVKLASKRVLASGLGLSAGVMTYVSFAEIFAKSNLSFLENSKTSELPDGREDLAYLYATLCFFGGTVIMLLIDLIVKNLSGHTHDQDIPEDNKDAHEINVTACNHSAAAHDEMQNQADVIIRRENEAKARDSSSEEWSEGQIEVQNETNTDAVVKSDNEVDVDDSIEQPQKDEEGQKQSIEHKKLVKMGMNTAVAIALHNFPEGLATFVAALDNPKVGAVLAIAIGIHNIPEGLCVALPIYYATGNRMKSFGWALLSGASEPVAALLGWAVLANSFSEGMYAVLFGLVAGMMVIISIRELLPTAHRYDPEDTVVTFSFIVGMGIMALSLVLFAI